MFDRLKTDPLLVDKLDFLKVFEELIPLLKKSRLTL